MSLEPVEGWIILDESKKSILGYIKGCYQPLPYYFAAPRKRGDWYASVETPCLEGVETPVVLLGEASTRRLVVYNPLDARDMLFSKCSKTSSKWCERAIGFIELLESATGSQVGVTGSSFLLLEKARDLDVVVYGVKRGERAYKALLEMREEDITKPFRGLGREWSREDSLLHEFIYNRRVLQGVYRGLAYSARIVSCTKPAKCIPRRVLRRTKIIGVVSDSSLSYYTPAYYTLKSLEGREKIIMVTHRIRYQEIPTGALIAVEGLLEEMCKNYHTLSPDHQGKIKLLQGAATTHLETA